MNVTKGLIIKDLLQLKSYRRTLLMFVIIFTLSSLAQDTATSMSSILTIMMTLGFGMFSVATFNYDEMAKADRYILTLPLSKKDMVISKYILIICATVMGAILGMIIGFIISYVVHGELISIQEMLSFGLGGILGIGIVQSIQIPCIYKWGAEKGRILMFIGAAVLVMIIGVVVIIGRQIETNLPMENIINMIDTFMPIIMLLVIALVYYISYKVSYKIYMKKEV